MGWFAKKRAKNIDNLVKLPKPLLGIYIFCKILFGMGLGFLLVSYLQGINWQLYGWLLILLSFIITVLRIKKLLSSSLPGVCILWRFLLWFCIGLGVLLASYLQSINWQLYGWWLIVLSIIISIPSLRRMFKR